MSQHTEVPCRR